MRSIVFATAVTGLVSLLPLFGAVPPGKAPGPDLVVAQPVISNSNGVINVSWVVRNIGNQPSSATKLNVNVTQVFAEAAAKCSTGLQTLDIPPLAAGDSFKASAVVGDGTKTPPPRYRCSVVATVDPANVVKETNEANNQATVTADNFQGPPPILANAGTGTGGVIVKPASNPTTAGTGTNAVKLPPSTSTSPQVAPGEGPITVVPKMKLTTDPVQADSHAPFWLVLNNVDSAIDAKNVGVTVKCETYALNQPPYPSKVVDCPNDWKLSVPTSVTVPAVPHGSFKSVYQVQPVSTGGGGWGGPVLTPGSQTQYIGIRLTFHITNGAAKDLVVGTLPKPLSP